MIGIEQYCYDDLLFSGTDRIGPQLFFSAARTAENEKAALDLIRYSLTYYLGWSPEEAALRFSAETLERMGIAGEVKGRIAFPPEAKEDPEAKRQYLLARLYPGCCTYDPVPFTKACYDKGLLSGRLPEGFFDESTGGHDRAGVCLLHALRKDGYETPEKMYDLMAKSAAGRWLMMKKLKKYCDGHFSTPADFLKSALPEEKETEKFYRKARERIIWRRESARRRYGSLCFTEEAERNA